MLYVVKVAVILLIAFIAVHECARHKTPIWRQKGRVAIILCCGRTRCSDVVRKSRTNSTAPGKITTKISKKPSTKSSRPTRTKLVLTTVEPQDVTISKIVDAPTKPELPPPPDETSEVVEEAQPEPKVVETSVPASEETKTTQPPATTVSEIPSTESSKAQAVESTTTSRTATALITTSYVVSTPPSGADSTTTSLVASTTTTTATASSTMTGTTTTTKPKLCVSASCTAYQLGSKQTTNSTIPTGLFLAHGNRFIFQSEKNYSVTESAYLCLNLNMSLIALENTSSISKYRELFPTEKSVWTSGSNEGEFCNVERTYSWCSSRGLISQTVVNLTDNWVDGLDASKAGASLRCLALTVTATKAGLSHAGCEEKRPFLCEPLCNMSSCAKDCTKNALLFSNGVLKDRESFGIWAEICGGTFLFGNKIVNWTQNLETCCSLEMDPIIFTTWEEQQCVGNFTNKNWKGNFNYWTGGIQGCKGSWGWCSGAQPQPFTANLSWGMNQPEVAKEKENCLQMRVFQNNSGILLSDRECKDKYIFACKAKAITSLGKPKFPEICTKNASLFSAGTVKTPFTFGDWYTSCGKHLFFPFIKKTWKDAWDYCCSFGMTLLNVETNTKHGCLSKLAKRYPSVCGADLWTSGSNFGTDDYAWASGKKPLRQSELNWKSGQPKRTDGDCVFLQFSNQSANASTYSLGNCAEEKNFTCELPKGETESDTIQEECMAVYDISDDEMNAFKTGSFNASELKLKLKCFIKCVGDITGLFLSGSLSLSVEALRIVEEQSATPSALQNNFQIVDECGNKVNDGDECAVAAGIYQCGKEKAPVVTSAIQTALTNNVAVAGGASALPCVANEARLCRLGNLPCAPNASKQEALNKTGEIASVGYLKTSSVGRKYLCSYNVPMTYAEARDHCCQLGMRLADIHSQAELSEVYSLCGLSEGNAYLGEIFVNGQSEHVWCDSQKVVKVSLLGTITCTSPSCFVTTAVNVALMAATNYNNQMCFGNTSHSDAMFICTYEN